MGTTFMLTALLICHFIICIVFFVLIKADIFKISMQLFPLVLFLPVWGYIMVIFADRQLKSNKTGSKEIQLERLGLDENDVRGIVINQDESERNVVPLEEAILINDEETRRKLMIDVLKQEPGSYIDLLRKARVNEDTEITHYASTAIMEVQREFELKIRECEVAHENSPENVMLLEEYIKATGDYIHSGLVQDSLLSMQRRRYDSLLKKRIKICSVSPDIYCEAIDNLLELEYFDKAILLIDEAFEKWPKNEPIWLIKLKYYHLTGNGEMIKKLISDISKSGIYLSPAAKQKINFWKSRPSEVLE